MVESWVWCLDADVLVSLEYKGSVAKLADKGMHYAVMLKCAENGSKKGFIVDVEKEWLEGRCLWWLLKRSVILSIVKELST